MEDSICTLDTAPAVSIVEATFLVSATWIVPFQVSETHAAEPQYFVRHGELHAKMPGENRYRQFAPVHGPADLPKHPEDTSLTVLTPSDVADRHQPSGTWRLVDDAAMLIAQGGFSKET